MRIFITVLTLFLLFTTTFSYSDTECHNSLSKFSLEDFYSDNCELFCAVDSIFESINDTLKVGQMMIVPAGKLGKRNEEIQASLHKGYVGAIIYMRGTKGEHISRSKFLNRENRSLPLIYSMDAEPSLINGRIRDIPKVMKTSKIDTKQKSDSIASIINTHLKELEISVNFAPVSDVSKNKKIIGNRSYGSNIDTVSLYSHYFIEKSKEDNILTTAKHFPGHGLVTGDSHKNRVFIDGELKELPTYKYLIARDLIAIMVGHIDIINNEKYSTNGRPSSCSPVAIKKLLREDLGFKGIIFSDGLTMHALNSVGNPPLEAAKAGCDFLCMPEDEELAVLSILAEMEKNEAFREQVYESVRKIIRLKLCLGAFGE